MRKKFLSLVLAATMTMSLFVVGAGATSFKDDKDIVNKDAVDKMVSLNIINGKDNGQFDPKGTVTRAEMCKMICIAMSGGNDPKLSGSSVVKASFTDTKGHWAEGYIEYCVNMNIVAGMGDKTFAPDKGVTPTQAAKMLLVALGYDAAAENFTGTLWAINTNKIATQKDLYDEIQGIDANAPMARDNAAQMVNNFCDATMVKYEFGISGTGSSVTGVKQAVDIVKTENGTDVPQTILKKYYKLVTEKGTMTAIDYDSTKKEYKYTLTTMDASTADTDTSGKTAIGTFNSTVDYTDLFGTKVELMYKDKNNDSKYKASDDSVYDINSDGSKVIADGYMGDFSNSAWSATKELKFNGVKYDIETSATNVNGVPVWYFTNNNSTAGKYLGTSASITTMKAGYDTAKVRLLDVDDNGKVDRIILTPFNVEKVTYVGSDNVTVTTLGNKKLADITTYTGIAKDDQVVAIDSTYSATNKTNLSKADIIKGQITATRTGEYRIDGTYYTKTASVTSNPALNDTINFVAFGGELFYAKVLEKGATSKDIAVVVNAAANSNTLSTKPQATLMFADGTKKDVVISKMNGSDATIEAPTPDKDSFTPGSTTQLNIDDRIGELVTYVLDKDGNYELTDIATPSSTSGNLAGYDGTGTAMAYTGNSKEIGGNVLDDNAIVFVVKKGSNTAIAGNDAKVYTGKEIKNTYESKSYPSTWATTGASSLYGEVDGFDRARVAVINANAFPSVISSSNYAYLLETAAETNTGSKKFGEYKVWNGKEVVTLKEESPTMNLATAVKGSVIAYDNDGTTGMIKNVKIAPVTKAAITGWNEDKATGDISFATGTTSVNSKVDSDTIVLFVDSDKPEGLLNQTIQKASDRNGDGVTNMSDANALYLLDSSAVKLLVVDIKGQVNNDPTGGSTTVTAAAANAMGLNVLLQNYSNVTIEDNMTISTAVTIPAGKTLNVSGTLAVSNSLTVDGTLNVTSALTATSAITGTGTVTAATLGGNATDVASTIGFVRVPTVNVTGTTAVTTNAATVATGTTMTFNGALTVAAGQALTVNGNLVVKGAFVGGAASTVAGTLEVQGATTLTAAITGTGKLMVSTFNNTASAAFAQTKTVQLTAAGTAAIYEAVGNKAVANNVLILAAASSDAAATALTWFTAAGNATTAGTAIAAATAIPAGTYTASTCYTNATGTSAILWLK